tara:strand:- start:159 stop:419 length:261 start_codon:yes stop_codon:yes gene_type:complete
MMLIDKNWKMESDELNVKIMRRRVRKATLEKPRSEYWVTEGYYGTVKEALHGLVKHEVRATGLKNVEVVVAKIDKLHKLIKGLEKE